MDPNLSVINGVDCTTNFSNPIVLTLIGVNITMRSFVLFTLDIKLH